MDKTLKLNSNEEAIALYGSLDENLRFAEKEFGVRISARNHRLKISGDKSAVENAYRFFIGRLNELRNKGGGRREPRSEKEGGGETRAENRRHTDEKENVSGALRFFHRGKIIQGRGKSQEKYLAAVRDYDIVLGIGPAGTGKTFLAMAAAIDYLKKKLVSRIIMARPAVEAGENLGFLPGDMAAKVNPYLRPLYDALYEMMDYEEVVRALDRGVIEVAPLAYMRGRTLNNSFVILDEAQNCTPTQMKMFLTRLGQSSKAVVTGDITQIDLPAGKKSGLVEAQTVLGGVNGIRFVYFDETDVVRHPLVQEVIKAYERYDRKGPH